MHIGADTPLGVFPNEKAKRLLGWQPRDTFAEVYGRGNPGYTQVEMRTEVSG